MSAEHQVHTARLVLRRPDPETDLAEAFSVFSDPANWIHAPELRHVEPERTRQWLARASVRWDTDGLSYWVARLAGDGSFVGVGGVQRQSTGAWNLMYRVAGPHQRQGYASEVSRAGLAAAGALDAGVPVIAWIRAGHEVSQAVARHLGFSDQGLRVDPSDGLERLAFSDRPLGDRYGVPVGGD